MSGTAPPELLLYPEKKELFEKIGFALDILRDEYTTADHPIALVLGGSFVHPNSTPCRNPIPGIRDQSDIDLDLVVRNTGSLERQKVNAILQETTGLKVDLNMRLFQDYVVQLEKIISHNAPFAEPFRDGIEVPEEVGKYVYATTQSVLFGPPSEYFDQLTRLIPQLPFRYPSMPYRDLRPSPDEWNVLKAQHILTSSDLARELAEKAR